MSNERFTLRAAIFVILEEDKKVLVMRRCNTGWMDGKYTLPAGHFDGGETVKRTAVREAKEELGIEISEQDLDIVHVLHIMTDVEYIAYFLRAKKWTGDVVNAEPDKCDNIEWVSLDDLPENTIPFVGRTLVNYKNGVMFSEEGFE